MGPVGESDPWSVSDVTLRDELRRTVNEGESAVLATVVDVEGSAYRRPGAKMLVSPDMEPLGAVTAGCLEGPVVDLASAVLDDGRPRVETFDLMDDEWGLGLGCNGVIDILLEPVDASLMPALLELSDREPVTVLTVVESTDSELSTGDRVVLDSDDRPLPSACRDEFPWDVVDNITSSTSVLRNTGTAASVDVQMHSGQAIVFVDRIEPAPRLLLFGNQNDVNPVARLGRTAGFEVIVASARGSNAGSEDFPAAHDVVATHPTDLPAWTDDSTHAILMSHNFIDDRLALEALQNDSAVPYIGLMGPRKRFEQMRDELEKDGTTFTETQLQRISTPVGLDLGGDEPVQIALSVVSEALAVHNDRDGGRLRNKEGPIHNRADVTEVNP